MNRIIENKKSKRTNICRLAAPSEFKDPEREPGSTQREENAPVFQPKAESMELIWLSETKVTNILINHEAEQGLIISISRLWRMEQHESCHAVATLTNCVSENDEKG